MVFHVVYPVYFGILTTRWSYDHHTPRFWKQKPTEKRKMVKPNCASDLVSTNRAGPNMFSIRFKGSWSTIFEPRNTLINQNFEKLTKYHSI